MNGKWKEKILSLILVFAMVVQLFAGMGTVAEASDTTLVKITSVGAANDGEINLKTDIAGGTPWVFCDTAEIIYNGTTVYKPLGWVDNAVLKLITSGLTWTANDTIVLQKGMQFEVKDGSIKAELAEGYKLTYNGSTWVGETIIEPTSFTIQSVGAADATYKTINLVTDIDGAEVGKAANITVPYGDDDKEITLYWAVATVLQLRTDNITWAAGDTILLEEGLQFTVADSTAIYELSQGYRLSYDGTSWTGEAIAIPVNLTGLRTESAVVDRGDGTYLYQLYFDTNITVSAYYPGWDGAARILVNDTDSYYGDTTWDRANESGNAILYLQDVISTETMIDTIKIEAGTRYSIGGTVYEIANDFVTYNYDGDLHAEQKEAVLVTIKSVEACDTAQMTINLKTDIEGDTAWRFCDTTRILYNGNPLEKPLGWVESQVLQLYATVDTWNIKDEITLEKGTQFTVNGSTILYELAEGYKLTYTETESGNVWVGEAIIETVPVTITSFTSDSNISDTTYALYLNTDISPAPTGWNGNWDDADIVVNETPYTTARVTWADNGVLYYQFSNIENVDIEKLTIKAGTQFTLGEMVYEIKTDFTVYCYDGGIHDTEKVLPTKVTITGYGMFSHVEDTEQYCINFVTDIPGATPWNFANDVAIEYDSKVQNSSLTWAEEKTLQLYVVRDFTNGESITFKKGLQFVIEGTTYEIAEDYTVYYYDNAVYGSMYYEVTQTVNGVENVIPVTGAYTLPEVSVDGRITLGWKVNGALYETGSVLPANKGGYSIEAVCIAFEQLAGAQVRLKANDVKEEIGGIRFVCKLDEDSKNEFITQMGMLVIPADYLTAGELTHDNYDEQAKDYSNKGYREFILKAADMTLTSYGQDESAKAYYLDGSIVGLFAYNYTRSYAARSYVRVAYYDGEEKYIYSDFSMKNNCRRICDIAKKMILTDADTYKPATTQYPIVYQYAKVADTMTGFGYFGPKIVFDETTLQYSENETRSNIQAYANLGFDYLWLDAVSYHYHDRYGGTTVEQEAYYFENPTHPTLDLKTTMRLAAEYGLGVIVHDNALRQLTECDIALVNTGTENKQLLGIWLEVLNDNNVPVDTQEFIGSEIDETKLSVSTLPNYEYMYSFEDANGVTQTAGVKNYVYQFASYDELKEYVAAYMSAYAKEPNFYGVMLCDEPNPELYAQAALMNKVIKELYPDAYTECCQFPYYDGIDGNNQATLFERWKTNISTYLDTNSKADNLLVDFYPYLKAGSKWLWWPMEGIRPYYLESLQYMATVKNERKIDLEVAVQTYEDADYSNVTRSMLNMQYHLAAAYGADKIHAFMYNNGLTTSTNQTIASDTNLQGYVSTANRNINYIKVHMTFFDYVGTSLVKGSSYDYIPINSLSTVDNEIISTSLSGNKAVLVNKFTNSISEEKGYYIVNISESESLTLNLTSNCMIYSDYTKYKNEENAENATNSVTLAAGSGAFVVPVASN